jgi:hypothetical protein
MADSTNIENKTTGAITGSPQVVQQSIVNPLNKYRSYTYNFTLSAVRKNDANIPENWRKSASDLVIIQSGGKGNTKITNNVAGVTQQVAVNVTRTEKNKVTTSTDTVSYLDTTGVDIVNGFNKDSPGRFDMFIDNVEIDTLMGFDEKGGTTLPNKISFEVLEPYSINGFMEAMQVAAVAAGYPSYVQASFLLKMEFVGYPDSANFSSPQIVPKSTRYFLFAFNAVDVEITERGTRYRCTGVPYNDKGFGQPNVLNKALKMQGATVGSMLKNFIDGINKSIIKSDDASKNPVDAKNHDQYAIKFLDFDPAVGFKENSAGTAISNSKILELMRDNAVYGFQDPGQSTATTIAYVPGETIAQFSEGANIHECISSVIRDSEYSRNILKQLGKSGYPDEYGFVDYFLIRIEVENLAEIDDVSKKPFQKFTYVVSPYKIHYTKIPNYGSQQIDATKIKQISNKEYNYIYTGKNTDVLNFKLNFNSLYFEAVPAAMGNNDTPSSRNSAARDNAIEAKAAAENIDAGKKSSNGVVTTRVTVDSTKVQPQSGGKAGQVLDDPYAVMAINMHEAIVNSRASMLSGEIEIIGDPFYIATGGIGSYIPKPAGRGATEDGEADHCFGEVMITVNFKNPTDLNPKTGSVNFDPKLVPFSGVYRVTKANSMFKDGVFKQRLQILRIPGQILDDGVKPSNPADKLITAPNPADQFVTDTTLATAPSARLTDANALTLLGRGLPSPGLPGALSNFTAALGGLGGTVNSLLTQVGGAVQNGIGQLTSAASVYGEQISSAIRLKTAGLANLSATGNLNAAGTADQISNTLQNALPTNGTPAAVAASIGVASNLTSLANSLGSANQLGNVGNAVTAFTQGIPTDATAVADKLGFNPAQLAGLGADLKSKILSQATAIADQIPSSVDLTLAKNRGLVLDYIPADKLANIPATAPDAVAPQPVVDTAFLASIKAGGLKALASAYGVSSIANIPGGQLPTSEIQKLVGNSANTLLGLNLPGVDSNLLQGKLSSVQSQLAGVTGAVNSVEANISSVSGLVNGSLNNATNLASSVSSQFGSVSKGTSPLTNLMTG